MLSKNKYAHLSLQNSLENAEEFSIYLSKYYDLYFKKYTEIFNTKFLKPIDYQKVSDLINNSKFKTHNVDYQFFENGAIKNGIINNVEAYGLFVNLPESKYVGFLESHKIKDFNKLNYDVGETIKVKICTFNNTHNKYELDLFEIE